MLSSRSVSLLARRTALRRVTAQESSAAKSLQGGKRFAGDMPVPNSSKARLWEGHPQVEEGWEKTIYFYYSVSFVAIVVILNFTPDTTIEAWAQNEARARLKLKDQGFTDFEFGKHYQDELMNDEAAKWDKFSMKAIKPGEDDDDDDEDEDEDEEEEEEEEEGDDDDDDDE